MTDKEKMMGLLKGWEHGLDSIDAILNCFLYLYGDDISILTMHNLSKITNKYLGYKVEDLETARFVGNERAGYIKKYLEGKMWPNEEIAKKYLQPQIDNAQAIIDACKC